MGQLSYIFQGSAEKYAKLLVERAEEKGMKVVCYVVGRSRSSSVDFYLIDKNAEKPRFRRDLNGIYVCGQENSHIVYTERAEIVQDLIRFLEDF